MNVLKKLTIQDLKLNKKRTIVTIIGIILSTALICAVAGMITSFQATLIEEAKTSIGNFHAIFDNVTENDKKYILENRDIKETFITQNLGYAKLENSQNEYKPYLYLKAFDDKALGSLNIKLIEGRLPNNDKEIIISEKVLKDALVPFKIGEKLSLDLSERYLKNDLNNKLDQSVPYGGMEETVDEVLKLIETKEYEIVGIFERPNYIIEDYNAPGYTAITKYYDNDKDISIGVLYKNIQKTYDNTEKIVKYLNKTSKNISVQTNDSLLDYYGVGLSDTTMSVFYNLGFIVIAIIIISSIFVIKNSFSISITEKMKSYGMLASIGATRKQIKKNVLYEGFILGVIAIPLGILFGILAVFILVHLINFILADFLNGISFVYKVPLIPIVLSAILSSLTIYFSTIFIARRASKVSPITAIRSNQDIKIKAKKLKTPKIIKKIFKIGGEISYKNLKRSKRKYRTTVVSLVVSIVIFIALSSFIDYGFKMSNVYYKEMEYNFYIYYNSDTSLEKEYALAQEIVKLEGVEKANYYRLAFINADLTKWLSEFGKKVNDDMEFDVENENLNIIILNEEEYDRYIAKLGGNASKYKDKAILVDDYIEFGEDKKYQNRIYNLKQGDIIEGLTDNNKKINIEIAKVTDKRPMGFESTYSNVGYLFVNEDFIDKLDSSIFMGPIYLKVDDADNFQKILDEKIKADADYYSIEYYNYEEELRAMNAMVLVISIFLYGFITVITLIGVTNIFNTVTTNMSLRTKEFMMLKSIGMTSKEFNHMIRLESIFYGLKSLIIGIPIGTLVSYFIYKAVINSLEMPYILPIKAIVICIIFVFIIVGLTMKYSLSKINKENIIESIRNDNI